jgi:hypothetical protein
MKYIKLDNFNDDKYLKRLKDERIKEDLEMQQHIQKATIEIINNRIKLIRDKRDVLLAKSDYYFNVPDIKITDEKKEEILKYRQELRNFPNKIIDGVYDDKFHILCLTMDEILEHLPKLYLFNYGYIN